MFIPKRIILEKGVLQYETAKQVLQFFEDKEHVEIIKLENNRLNQHIPGDNLYTQFREGKRTLVVDTKKSLKFQSCKPSAHYQLPLVTGCMGQCEYCYLNTNLGDKPFVRVHANVEEILGQAAHYMEERTGEITIFEGAAASDPIPVEPYTNSLAKAIEFFGKAPLGRFRFVTKFTDVDSLLTLPHNGHTEIRFSLNTETVIKAYEGATASAANRIDAAIRSMKAGYPVGFLIAPVFIYDGWKMEYRHLLEQIRENMLLDLEYPLTFEVISHRFTTVAKNRILEVFPETSLPMDTEKRQYKYGQFGYGKYVYTKEDLNEMKTFFTETIQSVFDGTNHEIKYII